jgi:hypothetical protein
MPERTDEERLKLQGELAVAGFGMAFRPDGKTLASGDQNKLVRLWDVPPAK